MAKKEFTYRGKSLEELQAMSVEDFAKLCDARARRSLKKGYDKKILKTIEKRKDNAKAKPIRTHNRDLIVIPAMVGAKMAVYRGNNFEQIDIDEKMLGHYIGEFVFTRKRLQHGKAGIGATKSSTAITARWWKWYNMAKKNYQSTVGQESKTARAMTTNANISLKYSTEICNQLKGKNVDKSIAWLTRIINHEEFLPLKRYNSNVAHRKGDAKEGVKSGRYPQKTIKSFVTLIESAKSNADFKGLDDDKLMIIHAFASKGISRMSNQSKGKIGGKARRKNATHIEVIVSEVKA